jgi:SAM-dependent methyltransferase
MSTEEGHTSGAEESSAYARMHLADWVPGHYDKVMYAPGSYDSFIWSLERPFLRDVAASLDGSLGKLRLLDFACGTGRIVIALEDLAAESLGVDISPQMLSEARAKALHTQFRAGDILEQPHLAPGPYELITAIRFFLNTEDEMRSRVMVALRGLLAGPESRLVFNIHMNSVHFIPNAIYKRLHGWPPFRTMSYWQARRLAREAGLEVVELHGFGFVPQRLHRGPLARLARWLDRKTAGRTPIAWALRDMVFVCRLPG